MEIRAGQDKILGMPTTLGFNPQNREPSSSSKLSSPSLHHHHHVNNTLIFNHPQTLDPFYQPQTQHHHHHHQPQQSNPYKPRDPDPVPNPDPNLSPAAVCTTPRATSSTPRGANHSFKAAPSAAQAQVPVPEPVPASKAVRYRECLKNHAATTGGHVLDGCGEFMPSGEEDSPGGLKCAACDCHRNFHRKEIEGEPQLVHVPNNYHVLNHPNKNSHSSRRNASSAPVVPSLPAPPPVHHHHQYHHFPATSPNVAGSFPPGSMMTFGGGGGAAESSSEDLNHMNMYDQSNQAGSSRKRFRTKFSQEQKDKMMEVAEKLGWRIQKHDEHEVQQLCSELGVKRQVFKVWMHNNKQAMKKKQL